jgi:hypothetical protein
MAHPLASHLAPLIDEDLAELRSIVARWIMAEQSEGERARYRRFGAELRAVKGRIARRTVPPSEEEVEIALTAVLALAGRRQEASIRLPEVAASPFVLQGMKS